MITFIGKQKKHPLHKLISGFVALTFIFSVIVPPQNGFAQSVPSLQLPVPGTMVPLTAGFTPPMVNGITVHPDDPFKFNFLINRGDHQLQGEAFSDEAEKLMRYFLVSLTVPEEELWVNLSPYEEDRIIPDSLSQTEMGRDLLMQDYMLKQLTASLMYPENELGRKFWSRIHEKTGIKNLPVDTFNKVWIVPQRATVYETQSTAIVIDSHLKVMLESDYLATQHAKGGEFTPGSPVANADIIKTVIIPEIEKEVNEGETFANLRQIYNSMILATWYKQNLKESLLGQSYVDQKKMKGVDTVSQEVKTDIYGQYLEAFKVGVYNYVREDINTDTGEVIPRKYFAGGLTSVTNVASQPENNLDAARVAQQKIRDTENVLWEARDADGSSSPLASMDSDVALRFVEDTLMGRMKNVDLNEFSEALEVVEDRFGSNAGVVVSARKYMENLGANDNGPAADSTDSKASSSPVSNNVRTTAIQLFDLISTQDDTIEKVSQRQGNNAPLYEGRFAQLASDLSGAVAPFMSDNVTEASIAALDSAVSAIRKYAIAPEGLEARLQQYYARDVHMRIVDAGIKDHRNIVILAASLLDQSKRKFPELATSSPVAAGVSEQSIREALAEVVGVDVSELVDNKMIGMQMDPGNRPSIIAEFHRVWENYYGINPEQFDGEDVTWYSVGEIIGDTLDHVNAASSPVDATYDTPLDELQIRSEDFVLESNIDLSAYPKSEQFVKQEVALLQTESNEVVVVDENAMQQFIVEAVQAGLLWEGDDGSYYYRSHVLDTARAERPTEVDSDDPSDKSEKVNWRHTEDALTSILNKQLGAHDGETTYVIPYINGEPGTPTAFPGIQVTDNIHVVLSYFHLYKEGMGVRALQAIEGLEENYLQVSQATHPKNGTLDDVRRSRPGHPEDIEDRQFAFFKPLKFIENATERIKKYGNNVVRLVFSGYGGNAIAAKKFALRFFNALGVRSANQSMAHQMFLIYHDRETNEVTGIVGSYPSMGGKTNEGAIQVAKDLEGKIDVYLVSEDLVRTFFLAKFKADTRYNELIPLDDRVEMLPFDKEERDAYLALHKDNIEEILEMGHNLEDGTFLVAEGINELELGRAVKAIEKGGTLGVNLAYNFRWDEERQRLVVVRPWFERHSTTRPVQEVLAQYIAFRFGELEHANKGVGWHDWEGKAQYRKIGKLLSSGKKLSTGDRIDYADVVFLERILRTNEGVAENILKGSVSYSEAIHAPLTEEDYNRAVSVAEAVMGVIGEGAWNQANARISVPLKNYENYIGNLDQASKDQLGLDSVWGFQKHIQKWGGRSPKLEPLVRVLTSPEQGVYDGLYMRSLSTAAMEGATGQAGADPFAQGPFFSTTIGRYAAHLLDRALLTKMFFAHNNYFKESRLGDQKDRRGKFLWAGFSTNNRINRWLTKARKYTRGEMTVEQAWTFEQEFTQTPLGLIPTPEASLFDGLRESEGGYLTEQDIIDLTTFDVMGWRDELIRRTTYSIENLKMDVPDAIRREHELTVYALNELLPSDQQITLPLEWTAAPSWDVMEEAKYSASSPIKSTDVQRWVVEQELGNTEFTVPEVFKKVEKVKRRYVLGGNYKMNLTPNETVALIDELAFQLKTAVEKAALTEKDLEDVEIVLYPTFAALEKARERIDFHVAAQEIPEGLVLLGAQNVASEEKGAYTGEESILTLKEAGVDVVLVGHSERRQLFGETNELVRKKVELILKHGLRATVAVGETLAERQAGNTFKVIGGQWAEGTRGFTVIEMQNVDAAYEPVWAIGTGEVATNEQANEAHQYLRAKEYVLRGAQSASETVIAYGGSVKGSNITGLIAQDNVDGGLVGGASLDPVDFAIIVAESAVNLSASSPVGGIDLDADYLNLNIEKDGQGIVLPAPALPMQTISINGLIPVILNVSPVNVPLIFGSVDFDDADPLAEGEENAYFDAARNEHFDRMTAVEELTAT